MVSYKLVDDLLTEKNLCKDVNIFMLGGAICFSFCM